MKIFVTGASGYVGSAVTKELLEAGHQVVGLARSDKSADALVAMGAEVLRGDLTDLESLRTGARESDGVIHLAYMHDFSQMASAAAADFLAVQTMLEVLEGTDKPFVGTSGSLMVAGLGRTATELDAGPTGARRVDSEDAVTEMADRGVRTSVVRLAPTVHSDSDKHGFIPMLIKIAREKGLSGYVGDGTTRWPAVHVADAARLYRLAVEKAPAGSRLHGIAEEGIPFKEIAEAIGRHVNVPVASITTEEATAHFGFLGALVAMDNPISNEVTKELLGWNPTGPTLIEDLDQGHYFAQ